MITRNELLESIIEQCNICKHLYTKVPEGGFDYRPTPGQRSTVELLRFIATCGIAPIKVMLEGNWAAYHPYTERVANMTPEEFPAAMDLQIEEIREAFAALN